MNGNDRDLLDAWRQSADAEPSTSLDALIVKEARQSLERRAKEKMRPARTRFWWGAWAVPLSAMAVAGVGLVLSLRVADEAAWHAQPAPAPSNKAVPSEAIEPAAEERRSTAPTAQRGADTSPRSFAKVPRGGASASAPIDSSPLRKEAPAGRVDQPAAVTSPDAAMATEGAPQPSVPDDWKDRGREVEASRDPAPPPVNTFNRLLRPKAPAAPVVMESSPSAGKPEPMLQELMPRATAVDAPIAPAPAVALPEPAKLKREAAVDGPAARLGELQELLRHGRTDEARAGVRAFRERYPDYPLPAELSALLEAK